MRYKNGYEVWLDVWHRIRVFNGRTGSDIPDLYLPKYSTTKKSLLGLRHDLDELIRAHNVVNTYCSFRFIVSMRERIEALSDIVNDPRVET